MEDVINFVHSMSVFGRIEFFVFVFALIFYIGNMARDKKFVPNPVAFGIWLLADVVNYITYVSFSEYWIGPLIMVIGAAIVVFWGIVKMISPGEKDKFTLSSIDYIAIGISVISLLVYFFTNNGKLSNILIQIVTVMGFVPIASDIFKKKVSREPLWSWMFFLLGWAITVFDTFLGYQSLVEILYPLISFLGCGIILFLIIFYRPKLKKGFLLGKAGCVSISFFSSGFKILKKYLIFACFQFEITR